MMPKPMLRLCEEPAEYNISHRPRRCHELVPYLYVLKIHILRVVPHLTSSLSTTTAFPKEPRFFQGVVCDVYVFPR